MQTEEIPVAQEILDNSELKYVFVLFKFQNIKPQSVAESFLHIVLFEDTLIWV